MTSLGFVGRLGRHIVKAGTITGPAAIPKIIVACMHFRRLTGHFIAEHVAVLIVLFLLLTFPLINLATSTYRYNMLCGAATGAAHAGTSCSTFTGIVNAGPDPNGPGVAQAVQAFANNYLGKANGINNVVVSYRISQTNISTQVVTHNNWQQPLNAPADTSAFIYSIEVVIDADTMPLYPMVNIPMIPNIPGLTGPAHQTVSAQELSENASGLNQ